jgi:hypothetical protein
LENSVNHFIQISAFLREVEEEDRDIVLEYWQSEHHRFEYGILFMNKVKVRVISV